MSQLSRLCPAYLEEVQKTEDILSLHHSLLLDLEAQVLSNQSRTQGATFLSTEYCSFLSFLYPRLHTHTFAHTLLFYTNAESTDPRNNRAESWGEEGRNG